jgi:hypothetical protein
MRTLFLVFLLAIMPLPATAQHVVRPVNVYEQNDYPYPYISSGVQILDFSSPALPISPCFPYSCEGIEGPFRNPDPTARDEENLTACIYGADSVLLYEREGKVCPYTYTDSNTMRVARRKQEWLRSHER